jgi:predicted alpha/beta-hydrolase family hydrolase
MTTVVLLPGFGGSADQPILVKLEHALDGLTCLRLAPPRLKLTPELTAHVDWLSAQVKSFRGPLVVVGRSFGGRLAVRLANQRKLRGVVLLGFPIRPPSKPRPLDEQALSALECPTLIVQGEDDDLGPLKVLRQVCAGKRNVAIEVIEGAGHGFTSAQERSAITLTRDWISQR